jgi:hypothetical protein
LAQPPSPPPPYTRALLVSQDRRRHLFVTLLGLTVVSVVDPQAILLALNQLPVHGDLHVQRRLRLQQGLKGCQSVFNFLLQQDLHECQVSSLNFQKHSLPQMCFRKYKISKGLTECQCQGLCFSRELGESFKLFAVCLREASFKLTASKRSGRIPVFLTQLGIRAHELHPKHPLSGSNKHFQSY